MKWPMNLPTKPPMNPQPVIAALAALLIALPAPSLAQKTLASTLEVYVFPSKGQDASQQSQDESACYEWAVGNTGSDPFDAMKQQAAAAQQAQAQTQAARQAGRGAGTRGAFRGAAGGALIGEIVDDDASKGAAYGAAIGAVSARRRARHAQRHATAQASQSAASTQQATAQQVANFKKAFSVCLEAKDYMVKY